MEKSKSWKKTKFGYSVLRKPAKILKQKWKKSHNAENCEKRRFGLLNIQFDAKYQKTEGDNKNFSGKN